MTDDGFTEEGEKRTLKEIADAAGVSIATVSRVLNPGRKSGAVKEDTRLKVLEAAQGFAPRARKKTLAIGIIVPTLTNPVYGELAQSLIVYLRQEGFTAIVTAPARQGAGDEEQRATVNALLDQNVAGIIAAPDPSAGSDEAWKQAIDQRIPLIFVALEGKAPNLFSDVIRFADRIAARAATHSLLDQGHSRIGVLAGPENNPDTEERLKGIREAFNEKGLPPPQSPDLVRRCSLGPEPKDQRAREEAVRGLLKLEHPPTAIFALDMRFCRSALPVIKRLKQIIPSDISLVTFSDASWATDQLSPIKLTTITHVMDQLVERAVRQLLFRIEATRQHGMGMERLEIDVNPEIRNPGVSVRTIDYRRFAQAYEEYLRKLTLAAPAGPEPVVGPDARQHLAQGLLALGRLDLKRARYGMNPIVETEPGSALAEALPEPEKPSQFPSVESHSSQGVATWFQGNLEDAEKHFQQGLDLAQDLDRQRPSVQTRELVCEFLTRLGKFEGNQGEFQQAYGHLRTGLDLAQARDMPAIRGEFLMHLGWIEGNQGDYSAAEAYLKGGLEEAGKLTDPSTAAKLRSGLLLNLGWIAHCRGDFEAAERMLRDGLHLAERYKLQIRMCGFLENLSTVARYRGDKDEALKQVAKGLALPEQNEHPPRRCGLLHGEAWYYIDDEKYDKAHTLLEEGFALAVRMRYRVRICEFLLASGYLDLLQARASGEDGRQREMHLQDANDEFMAAQVMATKMRHRFLISSANIWLGELYLEREKWGEALSRFSRGRMVSTELHTSQPERLERGGAMSGQTQRVLAGWAEYGLARTRAARGKTEDPQLALEHGRASLAILNDIKGLQRFGGHHVADVALWVRQHENLHARA